LQNSSTPLIPLYVQSSLWNTVDFWQGDPHGAAFWLDFLAVKSGNGQWLLSTLEQGVHSNSAAASLSAFPGMAYAGALAVRAREKEDKSTVRLNLPDGRRSPAKDHTASDETLRQAMKTFPQVIVPLADKIGASLPDGARRHAELQIEAGYS
jgi:hypothetical protein